MTLFFLLFAEIARSKKPTGLCFSLLLVCALASPICLFPIVKLHADDFETCFFAAGGEKMISRLNRLLNKVGSFLVLYLFSLLILPLPLQSH